MLWKDAANWSPAGVPGAADSATIGAGQTVVLGVDVVVANLTVGAGTSLQGVPALTVTGTFTNNGANLDDIGAVTIASTGIMDYNGAGNSNPRGTRPLTNNGIININSGTLVVGTNSLQSGGILKLNGGNLKVVDALGIRGRLSIQGGSLAGIGVIDAHITNTARVAPGHSPGTLTINGNYTQTSSGVLDMEIGGTAAGTGYDQLIVNGSASLAGTINIIKFNNYLPASGSSFKLLTYYSVAGSFATVTGRYPGSQRYYTTTLAPSYYLATCNVDSTVPSVTVKTPVGNGNYATLSSATGTASDGGSGLESVTAVLYRYGAGTTPAGYWAGGSTWTTSYSASNERPASGTSNWSVALPTVLPMKYYVRATAKDKVGNIKSSSNIIYNKTGVGVSSIGSVSPVLLSTAAVTATTSSVRLIFSGALDVDSALDASRYSVLVNGRAVPVESTSYGASTFSVTLLLPESSLRAGDSVTIVWKQLLDVKSRPLDGRVGPLLAR